MITLSTIKSWFVTDAKPTQSQFWSVWDSFWHKEEKIPLASIDGVDELFAPINNHFDDVNAHALLFIKAKIYQMGTLQIFKGPENFQDFLEIGDVAVGFLGDGITFMPFGKYIGGDIQDTQNSWSTSPIDFS